MRNNKRNSVPKWQDDSAYQFGSDDNGNWEESYRGFAPAENINKKQNQPDDFAAFGSDTPYRNTYSYDLSSSGRNGAAGSRRRRRKRRNKALPAIAAIVVILLVGAGLLFGMRPEPNDTDPVQINSIPVAQETVPPTVLPVQSATEPTQAPAQTEPLVQPFANTVYYIRSQLSPEDQALYDKIYSGAMGMEKRIMLETADSDHVFDLLRLVMFDHPELFWIDGSSTAYEGDTSLELEINYTHTQQERQQDQILIDAYTRNALAGTDGLNQYEQVKHVYEYIIHNTDYVDAYDGQSICDVMLEGKGVCAGYAKTTQYLLQQLGIEIFYVTGDGDGEPHGWNILNVEGAYYQLDTTWGDPVRTNGEPPSLNYDYFCITTEEMYRDHTPDMKDMKVALPDCTATECNYYIREGRYFKTYDRNRITELFYQDVTAGQRMAMKFASDSLYQQARSTLIDNYDMYYIIEESGITFGKDNSWMYIDDDERNILTIIFEFDT